MGVFVINDHRIAGQAVHGVRRLGHQEKVQLADRWHLGSNAKAFTATLIARLVEQKKLSWNTPLEKLLPEHAAGMRPEYRDVTLLDLLSHRSGLSDLSNEDPLFRSFYDDARPLSRQRSDWAAAMLSRAPATKKRSEPKYSNSGYILAGTIAEKATGIPYETLIRREILKPLGLKTATFKAPGSGEPFGHVHGRAAKPRDSNPQVIGPAGNLRMSLQDWARFSLDQMAGEKGGGKLLTRESYRLLHRSQGGTEEALGWGVAPAFAGRRGPVISHTGSDGNWFAAVALFPDAGDGVLVVANAGSKMGGERAVLNVAMPILGTLSQPSN
jgi:CubicO group peptidase (beta-lactamase class C family)